MTKTLVLALVAAASLSLQANPKGVPNPQEQRRAEESRLQRAYSRALRDAVQSCSAASRCFRRSNLLKSAYTAPHTRRPAFANFSSLGAPGGVCWGYAIVHRRMMAFARFRSREAAPRSRAEARRVLLPLVWGVPSRVPGVSSIDELSRHRVYAPELRRLMEEIWVREFFKASNLSWALRVRNPSENLEALREIEQRKWHGEMPLLVVQFSVESQHVVLVENLSKENSGWRVHVVDSNIPGVPQSFFFDSRGAYEFSRSRNLYGRLPAVGLKVVERQEAERDYLGLAAECCLAAR